MELHALFTLNLRTVFSIKYVISYISPYNATGPFLTSHFLSKYFCIFSYFFCIKTSLTSFNYKAGISPVDSIVDQIEALAIKREKIDQLEDVDKKLIKLDKKRKALDKKFMQNVKFYEAVYDTQVIDRDILPTSDDIAGCSEAVSLH